MKIWVITKKKQEEEQIHDFYFYEQDANLEIKNLKNKEPQLEWSILNGRFLIDGYHIEKESRV